MDVDNIPVGINFEEYLKSQVAACDVVLSVIGANWLNAKDETDQRRLDKPDDFVAIELAAALARDIPVIPVLVDGTRMPKASELPASLKPFALRNAIQVRNTNFGSDAEQLITKMREAGEALALGRPERIKSFVLLSFNAHLVATFLLNIWVFLFALMIFFVYSEYNAGALAALVATSPITFAFRRILARDESVRILGVAICVVGLLAVAAIVVSPQFFRVGVLETPLVQSGSLAMGSYFLGSVVFFCSDWKNFTGTTTKKMTERTLTAAYSPRLSGLLFLTMMIFASATWLILYQLTDSVAAVLALVGAQLLVVGYCYALFRKTLGANPASARS